MSGAYSEFFLGGGTNFRHFFSAVFLVDLILSNISNKNDSRGGSGGMLPRKFFENLHTAMAILVLFEQFLNTMHFVRTVLIMRA